jgi:excisionase family DNA binding protein
MADVVEPTVTKGEGQPVLEDHLLTPEEVAEHLRVSRPTVYAWLKMGRLQGLRAGKVWRIRPSDLNAFLQPAPAAEELGPGRKYSREEINQFLEDDRLDEETRRKIERLLGP